MTTPRVARRADVAYRLAHPDGEVSSTTQSKTWFFELPKDRDDNDGWAELLNRIFYDANTLMRHREPNDLNWLAVDSFTPAQVSAATMLAWDGEPTQENAESTCRGSWRTRRSCGSSRRATSSTRQAPTTA